ncbi:MAG: hypothetical protein JWL59_924 [Chthoniobacteraceae bacterium]|nr:hypothetical protein [Chthoniobacteraceae bacterium]
MQSVIQKNMHNARSPKTYKFTPARVFPKLLSSLSKAATELID